MPYRALTGTELVAALDSPLRLKTIFPTPEQPVLPLPQVTVAAHFAEVLLAGSAPEQPLIPKPFKEDPAFAF